MKNLFFINVTNHEKRLPYYIHGAAYNYDQEEVNSPQGCEWYQLNICKEGSGILVLNGMEVDVNKGDSIIIYPHISYRYIPIHSNLIVSWVAFDGFHVNSMFKSIGINCSGVFKFLNPNLINTKIKNMLQIQDSNITEQGYEGSKYIYDFLLTLMKSIKIEKSISGDFSIEKLKPSIDFMNSHLGEQIGIEEIANTMNITPQHFCLIFKSIMKQRPFEYLNSLRINRAKNLLINRDNYSIKDISIICGYMNQSYFCQIFKKSERITPAKFRELYRSGS